MQAADRTFKNPLVHVIVSSALHLQSCRLCRTPCVVKLAKKAIDNYFSLQGDDREETYTSSLVRSLWPAETQRIIKQPMNQCNPHGAAHIIEPLATVVVCLSLSWDPWPARARRLVKQQQCSTAAGPAPRSRQ